MRRKEPGHTRGVIVAALILASLGSLAPALPASASDRPGPCDLHLEDGERVGHQMKELIRCATAKWEVPGGAVKAICIADRESGLNPKAVSGNGTYVGLYQHTKEYWPARFEEYAKPAWALSDNPLAGRTAVLVSVRMANEGGWGPWRGVGC